MRIPRILIALLAVLTVSGCTQQRAEDNYHDFGHWWSSKPSHMENKWGPINTGYFGQNTAGRAVLKPPGMEPLPPEAWHQVPDYGVAPMAQGAQPPVAYGESVSVFPLEEDENGVRPRHVIEQPMPMVEPMPMQQESVSVQPLAMGYGDMVKTIYFMHGSAHVGTGDRKGLAAAARTAKKRGNVSVTVVGHASHRVNTTDDPIRKKEINFEMAQKRANAVTNALISQGVQPGWVMAVSKGDDEPNMHPGKRSQEAADRRAEVFMNGQ